MRIPSPNYTQTPNDLFDHWLPHLSESELKVLLVIMRKTFGWHKVRDKISISQLSQFTGMLRETVIKATKSLKDKGVIIRQVIGPIGKQETFYELVVNEDSNNSYPSVQPTRPVGSDLLGSTDSQKKENTKENNKIVCVDQPPVAVPPLLNNHEKIRKKHPDGSSFEVSMNDLFHACIQNRKDWSEKEIDDVWKILTDYQTPMRDWFKFCDGTIQNLRKLQKIKEFNIKDKSCQKSTQKDQQKNESKNIKEPTSENDMLGLHLVNWRDQLGLPTK
jgi:phage replication O-like protein O